MRISGRKNAAPKEMGIVSEYKKGEKYGFITRGDKGLVFFHVKEICNANGKSAHVRTAADALILLPEGSLVEYGLYEEDARVSAVRVTPRPHSAPVRMLLTGALSLSSSLSFLSRSLSLSLSLSLSRIRTAKLNPKLNPN